LDLNKESSLYRPGGSTSNSVHSCTELEVLFCLIKEEGEVENYETNTNPVSRKDTEEKGNKNDHLSAPMEEEIVVERGAVESLEIFLKPPSLGSETGNISAWSGSYLTKSSQELGLKSNGLAHNGDTFTKEELVSVMESLFEQAHPVTVVPLGDKGLKEWIIHHMVPELKSKWIREFLLRQSTELNSKLFYQLILRFKEFELFVCKRTRKQPSDLTREDFLSQALYEDVITSQFYYRNFALFYKQMNPFADVFLPYTPKVRKEVKLPNAVQSFLTYKRRQGAKKDRIDKFRYELHRFLRWACHTLNDFQPYSIEKMPVTLLTQEHLQSYKNFLIKGIKSGRFAEYGSMIHLKNIKTFFGTLYHMGYLKNDITRGLRNIQGEDYQSRYIPSDVELEQFFEVIDRYSDTPQTDKLAFGFMLYLGFRSCELATLRWENINMSLHDVKFTAKGGKVHSLPLPSSIIDFLNEVEIKEEGLVFGVRPNRLRAQLSLKFRIYTLVAGWKESSGPHQLRHIFITRLTHQDVTPKKLKRLARHDSLDTTSLYIHRTEDEISEKAKSISFPWEED
jgi:integrase/recombinase XerD